ncbi:ATP-binding cassette domain-containing protein [Paenibacillus sp. 32O-W]|uniref:ATP-binding cassette domain-containing protein n=1 Tax=Paenibacillus sp. 32O-W TaxID=1695218 RepID=UPI0009EBABF4|nr:ABC transporter ATP-binding protein [Paenibacillus sp. 32O-W]
MMLEIDQLRWRRPGSQFEVAVPRMTLMPGITLLVGRNGAGKSSLLHLLATAELPTSGQILYHGRSIDRDLPAIRASIGFVPTGIELYEDLKTVRLLRYLAELKGGAVTGEIDRIIALFRLEPYRNRKIKTLPHGVRQRIALAQAWIGSPDYLFLDEPLNAMDSLERLQFIRHLAEYSRDRIVVVSTHELNEWNAWARRILWLNDGRPLFYGTTAAWTGQLPLSVWEGITDEAAYAALPHDSVIHVRPEHGRLAVRMLAAQAPGPGFVRQPPTMEDTYFIRSLSQIRNTG